MEISRNELEALDNRLKKVESDMSGMQSTVKHIEELTKVSSAMANDARVYACEARDTAREAVTLLQAAKGIGGFLSKHGPRIVAAIMAIFAYEGLSTGNVQDFLSAIFIS